MPTVDIATRLVPYALKVADVQPVLTDLKVAQGQKVRLTQANQDVRSHVRQLAPKQVVDLKRMIGIPDSAISPYRVPVHARPAVVSSQAGPRPTAVEQVSLWNSARNAVLGHSASMNPTEIASVNQWISQINPVILIFLYQDITVESNAQLILAPDVQVLFANDILIEKGGQIISQATMVKFDCASLKGFDGPPAGSKS